MITSIKDNFIILSSGKKKIPLNSTEGSKLVMPLRDKHLFNNQRVILKDRKGKIAAIGSWFLVVKFDNGDDGLYIRSNGKFWFRDGKDSNVPRAIAPLYFLKEKPEKKKLTEAQLKKMGEECAKLYVETYGDK